MYRVQADPLAQAFRAQAGWGGLGLVPETEVLSPPLGGSALLVTEPSLQASAMKLSGFQRKKDICLTMGKKISGLTCMSSHTHPGMYAEWVWPKPNVRPTERD